MPISRRSFLLDRSCQKCGSVFQTNRQDKLYCSRKCKRQAELERVGIRTEMTGKSMNCKACGRQYMSRLVNGLPHQPHFCSRPCAGRFKSMVARGEAIDMRALDKAPEQATAWYTNRELASCIARFRSAFSDGVDSKDLYERFGNNVSYFMKMLSEDDIKARDKSYRIGSRLSA